MAFGSVPKIFTQHYKERVERWKSKRDALDAISKQYKQEQAEQEAAQCTFAPVINPHHSGVSRLLQETKSHESRKTETVKMRQRAQARHDDPFRNSDFHRELPLPGQRKVFSVHSHLSKYLEDSGGGGS